MKFYKIKWTPCTKPGFRGMIDIKVTHGKFGKRKSASDKTLFNDGSGSNGDGRVPPEVLWWRGRPRDELECYSRGFGHSHKGASFLLPGILLYRNL